MGLPIPQTPPTFVDEAVKSVIRKGLTVAGTLLLAKYAPLANVLGANTDSIVAAGVGAVALGWSFIWGILNKKKLVG